MLLTNFTKSPFSHESGDGHEWKTIDGGKSHVADCHADDEHIGRSSKCSGTKIKTKDIFFSTCLRFICSEKFSWPVASGAPLTSMQFF